MDEEQIVDALEASDVGAETEDADLGDGGYCDPSFCYTSGGGWTIFGR